VSMLSITNIRRDEPVRVRELALNDRSGSITIVVLQGEFLVEAGEFARAEIGQ